jgi:glycosyltransferase involved in cell wall biosynthesis
MAGKVRLSVIIVTHNQSNILRFQIAALEKQAGILPSELEVIVTDDASEVSEVKQLEAILSQTALSSRLLQQRGDRFWAARARNRAIACARGDVLLFLDGDMIPEVDVGAKHVALHASLEKRIIAGNRLRKDIPLQATADLSSDDMLPHLRKHEISDPLIAQTQYDEARTRRDLLQSYHNWRVVLSCHMSAPAAPEICFDEQFKGYGLEDWEFAYRLTQHHGYRAHFAPEIIAYEVDQLGGGVGDLFRADARGRRTEIMDYLQNVFYFLDRCPDLAVEEVCEILRRVKLEGDQIAIVPHTIDCDLREHVESLRKRLANEGSRARKQTSLRAHIICQ